MFARKSSAECPSSRRWRQLRRCWLSSARQRARQNLPKSCGLYAAARASAAKPDAMHLDTLPQPPAGGPQRVVLDTNTVLEWLVFRDAPASGLGAAIHAGRLRWLASPRMLAELKAVLARPMAPRWDDAREHALTIEVSQWVSLCAEPTIASHPLVCRDPADQ